MYAVLLYVGAVTWKQAKVQQVASSKRQETSNLKQASKYIMLTCLGSLPPAEP
jgi:hypothetical protein